MMAQHVEPMDVDDISEFDNKENSLHHNVPPHTEKGYEELDVSELNMKLRYSMTPVSSPMSKSYTANRSQDSDLNNTIQDNGNSKSLDSTMTESLKTQKLLPLQDLPMDAFDSTRKSSVLRPLDGTVTIDSENNANVTVTVTNDSDENISFPSTSSSPAHTPEATTPVKDISKQSGSPIIRGLKSVLSMFRPSQSPISLEDDGITPLAGQEILVPNEYVLSTTSADLDSRSQSMLASTPLANKHDRGTNSKRESLVFNDDLEKELKWKDESTIIFSGEKIPIHKLFYQDSKNESSEGITDMKNESTVAEELNQFDATVEPMDISYNNSMMGDKTMTGNQTYAESDASVFLDCETTVNETKLLETTMEGDKTTEVRKLEYDVTVDIGTSVRANFVQYSDATRHNDTNFSMKSVIEDGNVNKTYDTTVNPATSESSTIGVPPVKEKSQIAELVASTALNVIKALSLPEKACEVQPVIASSNNEGIETEHVAEDKAQDSVLKNNQTSPEAINGLKEDVIEVTKEMADVVHPDTNLNTEDTTDLIVQKYCQAAIDHESSAQGQIGSVITTTTENSGVAANETIPIVRYVAENVPLPDDNENFDSIEFTETLIVPPVVGTEVEHPIVQGCFGELNTTSEIVNVSLDNLDSESTDQNAAGDMVVDKIRTVAKQLEKSLNELNKSGVLADGNFAKDNEALVTGDSIESVASLAAPIGRMEQTKYVNETEFSVESNLMNKTINMEALKSHEISNNILAVKECSVMPENKESVTEHHNKSGHNVLDKTEDANSLKADETPVDGSAVNVTQSEVCAEKQETPLNNTEETLLSVLPDVPTECAELENHTVVSTENVKDKRVDIYLAETSQLTHGGPTVDGVPPVSIAAAIECTEITELPIVESRESLDDIQLEIVDEDEELLLSENNSPYVFLSADTEDIPLTKIPDPYVIETESPFAAKTKMRISPHLSPKLPGKGYNLNFDEIEDPFASKTNIRLSPPPGDRTDEITNVAVDALSNPANYETLDVKNDDSESLFKESNLNNTSTGDEDIKNYPEMHLSKTPLVKEVTDKGFENADKTIISNAASNADSNIPEAAIQYNRTPLKDNNNTFNMNVTAKDLKMNQGKTLDVKDIPAENEPKHETDSQSNLGDITHNEDTKIKVLHDLIPQQKISAGSITSGQDLTETSSSEQSVYLSAGTSSGETMSILPVIDDDNPFATKSKIRQSPPPVTYQENPFATKSKMASSLERTLQTTSPMNEHHEVQEFIDNKTFDKSKLETENNESKDTCSDSSKATDENDMTAREVHTEDEDTMEGPFFEEELENCEDKMLGIPDEKLDFNHFTELPALGHDEIVSEEAGEMYIDAEAFEYLMNQNQSSTMADSGKESLFLKFDPLFAKRVNSDGVVDALSKIKRRQSTPKKMKRSLVPKDLIFMGNSPVAGPSHVEDNNASEDISEELNVTVSHKPTMAVPPAVNPVVTPRMKVTKPTTPTRANRLSMPFTSPAMAVIDRLLSLSANNSPANLDTTIPHMSAGQNEAEHALLHLRELLAEKELNVDHLRCETKELKDRLSILESQVSDLETESDKRLKNINELNQKLTERNNLNKKMASVVEEYERTIAGLIAGLEEDKKNHAEERDELIKDRDEQSAHLASMEVAFSDLHTKYEKTKQLIFSYKAREDTYKKSIEEFEENLKKMQNNYDQLKQHATSKLNHANQELEKINKGHEAEVLKMKAMIKRKDLHISSLEETLAQKTKANEELTSICDELINKVG